MAKSSFLKSAALAALAAALSLAALPAEAQDRGHGRWSGGEAQTGAGGNAQGRDFRSEAYRGREARREQQQQAAPAPPAPAQRSWAERRDQAMPEMHQGDDSRRGENARRWGSQRPDAGERYGRNWQRGGEVDQPAPAVNGAAPAVPDRGFAEARRDRQEQLRDWSGRNPTYADPDRNRSYRDGARNWQRDGQWQANRDERREDQWRDRREERRAYNDGWRDSNRSIHRHDRHWNHDWRHDHRYNWYGYRDTHRHIYRSGRYYAPYRHYYYRRLGIGFFLDSLFFSSRYWIADPWYYRLPPVYGPYRWVRYYDDVLLVDIYSGEVVDVIYDFFW